jgi:hypothetical protein
MLLNGLVRVWNHRHFNTALDTGVVLTMGTLGGIYSYQHALNHNKNKPWGDVWLGATFGACVSHIILKSIKVRPIATAVVTLGPSLYLRVVDDPLAPFD